MTPPMAERAPSMLHDYAIWLEERSKTKTTDAFKGSAEEETKANLWLKSKEESWKLNKRIGKYGHLKAPFFARESSLCKEQVTAV